MSNHRYRLLHLTVEVDTQFEDIKDLERRLKTAITEGDESVEIKIAGKEYFVEVTEVTAP
jgi:hypothetical protein